MIALHTTRHLAKKLLDWASPTGRPRRNTQSNENVQ